MKRSLSIALLKEDDDPWDEKTVDIRQQGIEQGERQRAQRQASEKQDLSSSSLVRSHESQRWKQILVTSPSGWWVVEMSDEGPTVQSISISRAGRPYTLSSQKELLDFEKNFNLDEMPWPGNIIVSKKDIL